MQPRHRPAIAIVATVDTAQDSVATEVTAATEDSTTGQASAIHGITAQDSLLRQGMGIRRTDTADRVLTSSSKAARAAMDARVETVGNVH